MLDEVVIELVRRFAADRDPRSYERLVEWLRPLVRSICRGYFHDVNDAEDAVQETFLKLYHKADQIRGNPIAWISATARRTCIDVLRRRRRRQNLAQGAAEHATLPTEGTLTWEAARLRLADALAGLDPELRELVMARFLKCQPLRVLAADSKVSLPTMSRRVGKAVDELTEQYRRMGFEDLDEAGLESVLGAHQPAGCSGSNGDPLRVAHSWAQLVDQADREASGWPDDPLARPIRVGVYISASSVTYLDQHHQGLIIEWQMDPLYSRPGRRFEFVAIVEPGYGDTASTEFAIREFELNSGVISADDAEGLSTLDVIVLGISRSIPDPVLDAILSAVRGGVGVLKHAWVASKYPGNRDPRIQALSMCQANAKQYCIPFGCGQPRSYRVLRRHPIFTHTRWSPGSTITANACLQCQTPVESATVLIERVEPLSPNRADCNTQPSDVHLVKRWPAMWVGRVGKGRALAAATPIIGESPGWESKRLDHTFLARALTWLAGRPMDALEPDN